MILLKYERETVICFNEAESTAELYTCSVPMMRKMDKLVEEFKGKFSVIEQGDDYKMYRFPKKYVKVRKPSKREGVKPENFERRA